MSDLFRKSALEKFSSPEQLDRTIVITSPLSWLAIAGLFIITAAFAVWAFMGTLPSTISTTGIIIGGRDAIGVHTSYGGILMKYFVDIGDSIKPGDVIAEISDFSGNISELKSTQKGIVSSLNYKENEEFERYAEIISLSPSENSDDIIVCYFSVDEGKAVSEKMKAIVTPTYVDGQKSGHMEAVVISVDDYVTSPEDIKKLLGNNDMLVSQMAENGALNTVVLEIKKDGSTASGYYWSSKKGADIEVKTGSLCTVQIITDESSPVSRIFPDYNNTAEG
ncbi:MAG: hypothetical protein LUD81_05965 [Clostridiales bacterium]|nr:hypothetical protein [Clostridiales bacterium]